MKWRLREISEEVKMEMVDYSVNPTIIERLMNGEALESLEHNDHGVRFHRHSGWVEKKLLKEANELIDIVQSESMRF